MVRLRLRPQPATQREPQGLRCLVAMGATRWMGPTSETEGQRLHPNLGRTGTPVTVTGSDLAGTTRVTFGGVPARSFTVSSDTNSAPRFRFVPQPAASESRTTMALARVRPASQSRQQSQQSRGRLRARRGAVIVITGSGFGARRGVGFVRIGAVRCDNYASWSKTAIRCRIPARATVGRVDVRVATRAGWSNAQPLT